MLGDSSQVCKKMALGERMRVRTFQILKRWCLKRLVFKCVQGHYFVHSLTETLAGVLLDTFALSTLISALNTLRFQHSYKNLWNSYFIRFFPLSLSLSAGLLTLLRKSVSWSTHYLHSQVLAKWKTSVLVIPISQLYGSVIGTKTKTSSGLYAIFKRPVLVRL